MKIRIIGRLAAVLTLGVLMLGTPLTAAAAGLGPTPEDAGASATPGELACDCATDPAAPAEVPPPDAVAPELGSSAPEEPSAALPAPGSPAVEEPAAAPPVPPAADSPAAQDSPIAEPSGGDTSTVEQPAETPTEEIPSGTAPAVDPVVLPTIDSPPDAGSLPAVPTEPVPAGAAEPAAASEVSAPPASSSVAAAETAAPRDAPILRDVRGSSPTPSQGGSGAGSAPRAAAPAVGQAAIPVPLSSAEGTAASAESTARDAGEPSEQRGHAGARQRTSPTAFDMDSGVETVTAGIAIMAPRGIPSTVSVAVEFGRAGHGWAGAIVFNVWLRRQMRERRMSQRQLALLSGVDHSTVSRLVSGERVPSLATATRLARALGRVDGDGDAFAYFARLPEETVFPTTRVEMALRGDDEINDDDVRSLMSAYLDTRTRRRRARQLSVADNGASGRSPGATDQTDARSPYGNARRGPKDASA